jgi:hypothetical protein
MQKASKNLGKQINMKFINYSKKYADTCNRYQYFLQTQPPVDDAVVIK